MITNFLDEQAIYTVKLLFAILYNKGAVYSTVDDRIKNDFYFLKYFSLI